MIGQNYNQFSKLLGELEDLLNETEDLMEAEAVDKESFISNVQHCKLVVCQIMNLVDECEIKETQLGKEFMELAKELL